MIEPNFGPNGKDIYERTYSRTKPDGTKETWFETVKRVAVGNASLVHGSVEDDEIPQLRELMHSFAILPAGRHLWASGVQGRQFLFNCWHSGWADTVSSHFYFTFMRLMEGGGVGATYSTEKTRTYGPVKQAVEVHVVCDKEHQDYEAMRDAGLLSSVYSSDYQGAYFEVEDSREGWAEALVDLLEAAWNDNTSPVRVYDVSRVRPAGARLKTFGGHASGPMPLATMLRDVGDVLEDLFLGNSITVEGNSAFIGLSLDPISAMEIDHAIAQCVVAGGNRRSARMSIMPWDDPYIFDFIKLKEDTDSHWSTNISVQVDEEFFYHLNQEPEDEPWSGYVADQVHWQERAKSVLKAVAEGMLRNGEPGIWNKSYSNVGEVHEVSSTNPCGEIPLPEWGACVLGHVNLEAFAPKEPGQAFALGEAVQAAKLMTRFLIRATFGDILDERAREVMDRDRRIGVGLFGFQAAFAKMGIKYSDIPSSWEARIILFELNRAVRQEARDYAFQLRIPEPIKVTTVAPTGTIAKLPGTSEGIHPIFSRHFIRRIRFSTLDPSQIERVQEFIDQGYHVEDCLYADNTVVVEIPTRDRLVDEVVALGYDPSIVQSADEVSLVDMLRVQGLVQDCYADNAVSFTVNLDPSKYTAEQLMAALKLYGPHLKGTTVFPDQSRPQAPYERISEADFALYQMTQVGEGVDEECASGACSVR
ncbi:ribonucleoside-triphosphate reductase, adenosylcobalamin-dependent [Actinomadura sp. KC216]|uniref:ribonucleoside-triphosphate reductase, adenosylcobalamin-dependent n=1 Tax=Actinomadura sp. KC216 TaxID=2530370 RepID=UPI001A9D14E0|nr:ribonucleoside-triphosphate reductase, adenosylcobalamin-dependent [Actinomadura sp. KC216]